MMDYREFTARTVDDAITQACMELGVTSDRLDYDVLQEASAGFLGIGARQAVIRARARSEEELEAERRAIEAAEEADKKSVVDIVPETKDNTASVITSDEIEKRAAKAAAKARAEESSEGADYQEKKDFAKKDRKGRDKKHGKKEVSYEYHEPSKPKPEREIKERTEEEAAARVKAAEDFLKSVFDAMNIEAELTSEYIQEEGTVSCTFNGSEMGILIGKRGQTLDSLQYLTSLVVNKLSDEYVRVKLDTEDYRARRSDTLNNLARNIAYKVKKTHRPVSLEPMNPYERRIIHSALQGNKNVETYSEGDEPYRHVVVAPKRNRD